MSDEIKIESGVPIPEKRSAQKSIYPFATMNVGDSLFIAVDGDPRRTSGRISSAASFWGKRHNAKFTCRTVENGVRCWRVK